MQTSGSKTSSKDGTIIAYGKTGNGPPVFLIDGVICFRRLGPLSRLAKLLSSHFTVYTYDRRGRGESGNTPPYSLDREIEDLEALVQLEKRPVCVFGNSSGAALALKAAERISQIQRLAIFEAPFAIDPEHPSPSPGFLIEFNRLLAENRKGAALKSFLLAIDLPPWFVALGPLMPAWWKAKSVLHTVPYDLSIIGERRIGGFPPGLFSSVKVPVLVLGGEKSPSWTRNAMRALADALPQARYQTLAKQTHLVDPKALRPVLKDFFQAALPFQIV
jgi:pimeloyl-ACP methyl ester carboxylesterase